MDIDRYQLAAQLSTGLGIASGIVLAKYVNDLETLQDAFKEAGFTMTILVVLVIVAVTTQVVRFSFEMLFDRISLFRRALLGNMFVEGTWIELVSLNDKPKSVAINHITPSGFSIEFSGDNYDFAGIPKNTFSAQMLRLNWPWIYFTHRDNPTDSETYVLEGYTELKFTGRKGAPRRYAGFFMHLHEGVKYNVEAEKIRGRKQLKRLDDVVMRREMIAEFVARMRPQADDDEQQVSA